jgi:hypothetical protein
MLARPAATTTHACLSSLMPAVEIIGAAPQRQCNMVFSPQSDVTARFEDRAQQEIAAQCSPLAFQ